MSMLTTHVLDTSRGRPAAGLAVTLEHLDQDGTFTLISRRLTSEEGRIRDFSPQPGALPGGTYRLTFEAGPYFTAQGAAHLYPSIAVELTIEADRHFHVLLSLSPFGYFTSCMPT